MVIEIAVNNRSIVSIIVEFTDIFNNLNHARKLKLPLQSDSRICTIVVIDNIRKRELEYEVIYIIVDFVQPVCIC